jgi:hypothetical protein
MKIGVIPENIEWEWIEENLEKRRLITHGL